MSVREQVHEATVAKGAYPSPLNYFNFPKSVCTSVNEVRFRHPTASIEQVLLIRCWTPGLVRQSTPHTLLVMPLTLAGLLIPVSKAFEQLLDSMLGVCSLRLLLDILINMLNITYHDCQPKAPAPAMAVHHTELHVATFLRRPCPSHAGTSSYLL